MLHPARCRVTLPGSISAGAGLVGNVVLGASELDICANSFFFWPVDYSHPDSGGGVDTVFE